MSNITLVEFFADWCHVCAKQIPIIDKLEKDFNGNVDFIKLNIDENRDLSSQPDAVPTMFILKNDNVITHNVGFVSEDKIRE